MPNGHYWFVYRCPSLPSKFAGFTIAFFLVFKSAPNMQCSWAPRRQQNPLSLFDNGLPTFECGGFEDLKQQIILNSVSESTIVFWKIVQESQDQMMLYKKIRVQWGDNGSRGIPRRTSYPGKNDGIEMFLEQPDCYCMQLGVMEWFWKAGFRRTMLELRRYEFLTRPQIGHVTGKTPTKWKMPMYTRYPPNEPIHSQLLDTVVETVYSPTFHSTGP